MICLREGRTVECGKELHLNEAGVCSLPQVRANCSLLIWTRRRFLQDEGGRAGFTFVLPFIASRRNPVSASECDRGE
jgi:hypothetical protein